MKKKIVLLLAALALPAVADTETAAKEGGRDSAKSMRDAFARMDHEDFLDGVEKADKCTRQRDFACAEKALKDSKDLASSSADSMLLMLATSNLQAEKQRAADEVAARIAEDARRRREEQQRIAAAQAEERRRQAAEAQNSGMQWGKLGALGLGAAAGGLSKLPADMQVKVVSGILQDSAPGQNGISNFQSAVSSGGGGASAAGGAASGGAASGVGGDEARNRAIAQRCKASSESVRPWNDPQTDSFCQLATFDKCLVDAGITAYEPERRKVCSTLKSFLPDVGGNISACSACN